MTRVVIDVLKGVAIGLANIIPGVSGGTMALVLGIYERLIRAIHNIGPKTIGRLFAGRRSLADELRRIDAAFLAALGAGAVLAIVAAAKLMVYLLERHHDATYGFFFGLVLISVVVPYKMIRRLSPGVVVAALAAIALVVGLSVSMSSEQRVASAQRKAELKTAKMPAHEPAATESGAVADERSKRDTAAHQPRTLVLFFVAGVVAISAMILPGISGSFILLLMGLYFDVLAAIVARQLLLLGALALGCLVGVLLFTRLIHWMLERYHDLTMSFLLGLVIGSLYAIWPFKAFRVVAGTRVDLHNQWPASWGGNELQTVVAALLGCAVVAAFLWVERRSASAEGNS